MNIITIRAMKIAIKMKNITLLLNDLIVMCSSGYFSFNHLLIPHVISSLNSQLQLS